MKHATNYPTAKTKYVRFFFGIVTFPEDRVHAEIAEGLRGYMGRVISAGFVVDGECVGKSISLRVHSREEDTEILRTSNRNLTHRDVAFSPRNPESSEK